MTADRAGGSTETARIFATLNALFKHGSPYHGDGLGAARLQASTVASARPRLAIVPNLPSFGVRVHVHRDTRLTGAGLQSSGALPCSGLSRFGDTVERAGFDSSLSEPSVVGG